MNIAANSGHAIVVAGLRFGLGREVATVQRIGLARARCNRVGRASRDRGGRCHWQGRRGRREGWWCVGGGGRGRQLVAHDGQKDGRRALQDHGRNDHGKNSGHSQDPLLLMIKVLSTPRQSRRARPVGGGVNALKFATILTSAH